MAMTFRPTLLAITSSIGMSVLFGFSGLFGCSSEELEGPEAEVNKTDIKLDLPAVPAFTLPATNADGSHSVPEMRLNGKAFLETQIQIQGTVLWIYDCGTAIRSPEMSDKDLKKMLTEHPEKCTRPHFIIGESAATKIERGIEVVEYPRNIRKDEKDALPDEMVAEMEAALTALPAFKVGDSVTVTGQWSLKSPKGFQNSEGLLIFGLMVNQSTPATE